MFRILQGHEQNLALVHLSATLALQQFPLAWGKKIFLHREIGKNLTPKISGYFKEIIPCSNETNTCFDSSCLSLFVQLFKHYPHNNLTQIKYPSTITYF